MHNLIIEHADMPQSTTLTIRVDRKVRNRFEAVAKSTRRSKSFLAAQAIEDYLAVQEWQIAGIKEAIKSIDEGRGIPHSEVMARIESWGSKDGFRSLRLNDHLVAGRGTIWRQFEAMCRETIRRPQTSWSQNRARRG